MWVWAAFAFFHWLMRLCRSGTLVLDQIQLLQLTRTETEKITLSQSEATNVPRSKKDSSEV